MATGGADYSRSVQGASDEMFDFTCTSCKKHKNRTVEAAHYCADCNQFYCEGCIGVHASIPALAGHKVLGRNQIRSWGKQKKTPVAMAAETCPQHGGEVLKIFCGNHNVICCTVCVSLQHRTCDDMQYIPDVAQGVLQSEELKVGKTYLEKLSSNTEKIKHSRQQKKESLRKSKKDVLQNIGDLRKRINVAFDVLEKNATDDLNRYDTTTINDIQEDIDACDTLMADIKLMKKQLDSDSTNDCQMFINLKKCQQQIADGDLLVNTLSSTTRNDTLLFTINSTLQSLLASVQSLGKLEMTSTLSEVKVETLQRFKRQNPGKSKGSTSSQGVMTKNPSKNERYKAIERGTFNVKMQTEGKNSGISGSCFMTDGAILVTDGNNYNVKRLDTTTYKPIDHCDIRARPTAVCCISQYEAAVSAGNTIYFVSVRETMAVSRAIQMKHNTAGVAYNNSRLYVSDGGTNVYIYNTGGTWLSTINSDNGSNIFSRTEHIAVSPDGTRIYLADRNKRLTTLDSNGQLISTFSDQRLSKACAVCVGDDGSVFVCLGPQGYVIQVDKDGGQMVGKLITIYYHQLSSVCINKQQSMLLVTTVSNSISNKNTVYVFDLKTSI